MKAQIIKKVLIIKTSSLGDILHTLPALTDASYANPEISFDWVVEEAFAEVPAWHPTVKEIIPVALRRWRKNPVRSLFSKEFRDFWKRLRAKKYAMIIDAQGLIKSAILARMCKGLRVGLNSKSVTEKLASFAYQKKIALDKNAHAVDRMRSIFSHALEYEIPKTAPDYGLSRNFFRQDNKVQGNYVVFVHGTTWKTKFWPDSCWSDLAKLIETAGLKICLPWASAAEQHRAQYIASCCSTAVVLPRMTLKEIAGVLAGAKAVVSIDTGLGHLSAALDVPTISLYGPTLPSCTGTIGKNQIHITAPFECIACDKPACFYEGSFSAAAVCLSKLTPDAVFIKLNELICSNLRL